MAGNEPNQLATRVKARMDRTVPAEISAIAEAARKAHGPNVLAVLAYGSSLRGTSLDETLIDLYLLVSDYSNTHQNIVSRTFNRLVPPNVYYIEHVAKQMRLRAKYAVISLDQFQHKTSSQTENPYFWARFAQPTALVWAKDAHVETKVVTSLAQSVTSLLHKTAPLCGQTKNARDLWQRAFRETYNTEFRPEAVTRARDIVDADLAYYEELAIAVYGPGLEKLKQPDDSAAQAAQRAWTARRIKGRVLSIVRLCKAAFTFQGGADYVAWKIARHSGVDIKLTDWQRRHPMIAGLLLLPKLIRKGGVR